MAILTLLFCEITLVFSLIILALRILVISYSAILLSKGFGQVLDDNYKYISLWNNRYIEDILLIDSLISKCPQNYELSVLGQSPSISFMCNLTSVASLKKGFCSSPLNIPAIPGYNITKWKGSAFCIKRSRFSYSNSTIIKYDSQCLNNSIDCGIIDNLNNKLCVPQNSTCPIKQIMITSNLSTLVNYTNDYKIQKFKNNSFLITSNDSKLNKSAISNLIVRKGSQCSNYSEDGIIRYDDLIWQHDIYSKAIPCTSNVSSIKYNPYFFQLDISPDSQLYSQNNIINPYLNFVNYKSNVKSFDNYLYYSSSPGVNRDCIDKLGLNLVKNIFNYEINSSLIISCTLGILVCILSFINLCYLNGMIQQGVKCLSVTIIMFLTGEIIFLIVTFNFRNSYYINNIPLSYNGKLCFDSYFRTFLENLKNTTYDPLNNFFILEYFLCMIQIFIYFSYWFNFSKTVQQYPNFSGEE